MDWIMDHAVAPGARLRVGGCRVRAVADGVAARQPAGNERMREISGAVQEGASAYLRRQYMTVAVVAIVPFLLLGFYNKLGWGTAFGFLIGAVLSAAAGFIGMNVAVRSNSAHGRGGARRARAGAERRLPRGLGHRPARRRPRPVRRRRLLLASSPAVLDHSPTSAIDDLVGLAFGGSLISVFARLGGGIYTKAADVGADLVGKIEAGIPEDDPRNPAVIADNVGDNVGDCAGMAADLFETYAVTAVAVMLLGTECQASRDDHIYLYPLALGAVSIVASVIGTFFARLGRGENAIINALYKAGDRRDACSRRSGFIPVTKAFDDGALQLQGSLPLGAHRPRRHVPARRDHRVLHRHPLEPGQVDREGVADRPRDEHHRGPRRRHAGDGAAGDRARRRASSSRTTSPASSGSASP